MKFQDLRDFWLVMLGWKRYPLPERVTVQVRKVLDANCFKLRNGKTVKLIGIAPVADGRKEAIGLLEQLVLTTKTMLLFGPQRQDRRGNLLAHAFILESDKVKEIEAYRKEFIYIEFDGEFPDGFWEIDALGNRTVNPDVSRAMKPTKPLYLHVNATLLNCGLADFVSMPPNTEFDDMMKAMYKDAYRNEKGVWKMKG